MSNRHNFSVVVTSDKSTVHQDFWYCVFVLENSAVRRVITPSGETLGAPRTECQVGRFLDGSLSSGRITWFSKRFRCARSAACVSQPRELVGHIPSAQSRSYQTDHAKDQREKQKKYVEVLRMNTLPRTDARSFKRETSGGSVGFFSAGRERTARWSLANVKPKWTFACGLRKSRKVWRKRQRGFPFSKVQLVKSAVESGLDGRPLPTSSCFFFANKLVRTFRNHRFVFFGLLRRPSPKKKDAAQQASRISQHDPWSQQEEQLERAVQDQAYIRRRKLSPGHLANGIQYVVYRKRRWASPPWTVKEQSAAGSQ